MRIAPAVLARRPFALGPSVPLVPVAVSVYLVLLVSVPIAIAIGAADIPVRDVIAVFGSVLTGDPVSGLSSGTVNIVWDIRFPRVILAGLVGAGLAAVGTVMQALVRNALADPYILGVSSGASVGAAAVIMFNAFGLRALLGTSALSLAGFVGAAVAMGVVYLIAQSPVGLSPTRLILGGVAASYMFAAVTSLLIFLGDPRAASSVMFWLLGGLGRANWVSLPIPTASVLVVGTYFMARARWLNALATGDETARTVGIDLRRFRLVLFMMCSVLTGVLVAISGAIGFVGLILPHFARLIVGADHRRVLVVAMPAGALFLIWADAAARTVVAPQVLPVGVITALIGGPLFIALLIRRTRTVGNR
jgi:iron complex transport system permease protein